MSNKRLLAILLALVMVFSNLSPAVFAVEAPADSVVNAEQNAEETVAATEPGESSTKQNGLVASVDAPDGPATARDTLTPVVDEHTLVNANGSWEATPTKKPGTSLLISELPECVEELRAAAELFAANEVVRAFVVMEDAPLAESYTSPLYASAALEKDLIEKQDAVISAIKKTVLNGEEPNVRYQFTYLTNSFSIETEFANLEKIAVLSGVKSVFVLPVYSPCTTVDPNTVSAGAMTGVAQVWEELDYTGTGMKIAVIDTGLDLDHPSFAADPAASADSLTMEDISAVLEDLNAFAMRRGNLTAEDLYRSVKVPYAFNYVDNNLSADHSRDAQGDHGTHVAGIAAANAVDGTNVVGMAPDAQIIVMKVFGANGGAYMDDIVAGLEDAMTLGCDVVNASLGSPAGFSSSDTELDLIYERLDSQDIVACYSAGNEGTSSYDNMWGTDLNRTQNPDNATIGSPALYANVFSIASAENAAVQSVYFSVGENKVFYMDPYEYVWALSDIAGETYEYVIIDGLGEEGDFYDADGNSLVEGKIAVVLRGSLSFGTKIFNAQYAGAAACLIMNNTYEDIYNFGMQIYDDYGNYPEIPSAMIGLTDGEMMAVAEEKIMTIATETGSRVTANGGQMSSFSSWGVSPDLRLVPDLTGIGGNVYSCYDGGQYGLMSGTSMSSPQVAGVTALVMQRLKELYPNAPDGTIRELALAMLMSTADPIISADSGVEASPRQQGAGLVDAYEAVTTDVYLTVNGERPKAELGDSTSGVYKFSFEIHNIGDEDRTYTLDASLLSEAIVGYKVSDTEAEYFMYGADWELDGDVTFSKDSVTVPAGGRSNVTVTITLSDSDKALFDAYWENGGYVEGYVYLANEEGAIELNLPFLGFYGDWTEAPVFDSAYWYDNSFWGEYPTTGLPEGDEYYHVLWTNLVGNDWVLGFNPYSGALMGNDGNMVYDPSLNVLSPNGDGAMDGLDEIYLSLLRNAKVLTFTYTVDGQVVHKETITNASKTMYRSSYGQVVPWLYSWYGEGMYNFKGLETGTEVILTIDAFVDYGRGGNHSIEFPITIDLTYPELVDFVEAPQEDGTQYLGVEVYDETAFAAVFLMNASGSMIHDVYYDVQTIPTEDGTYVAYFDVTGLGTEFTVCVCDYAANESYYSVKYTANGENVPDMSDFEDELFAYRVFDEYIYSDHMYGWISMNQPAEGETADISVWTDDYLEYAAINAAEFAGGKIFAVDAVYNLMVITPGLWSRREVCNLGVNVLDMTFDDSTDTMYVLTKDGYNEVYLCTLDLTSCELNEIASFGYYYYAPLCIADDDNGTLYAVQYGKSGLFTLNPEDDYAMEAVMVIGEDGVESALIVTDSNGDAVAPGYAQSMTCVDGKLYWAYYHRYQWNAELIAIDLDTLAITNHAYLAQAYDYENNLVEYNPTSELVGLLSIKPTDYEIPESGEIGAIRITEEKVILSVGASQKLNVGWLPWNYKLDTADLVWSSSDENVATVDENGTVSAVAEGTATITVAYGDLTASSSVAVVNIEGNFYAYNYYSGDGNFCYMIEVDMETMDYYLISDYFNFDFYAGDYNGHDGYYYGYDMSGQLYRYDLYTGELTALGAPLGTYPVDMAYDYSTGMMYAMTLDYNTYENVLYAVNMNNGKTMQIASGAGLLTLACSTEGTLYAMDLGGYLNEIILADYSMYDMGIYMEPMPVFEESFGELYMLQSMCWDHNNDVLLWNFCDGATVMWIDVEQNYFVDLGDPSESGVIELTGMFVIPEEVPELADVPVDSVTAEDMLILTGYEKVPNITVAPFNATSQNITMTSSDPSVVEVTASGFLKGVAEGTATVTAVLDDAVSSKSFEVTFNVTVLNGADNLYGHLMTDVATYASQIWIELFPGDTTNFEMIDFFDYTIFTEEYVDGKLYTYGYDPNDWTANWNFFILDADSYAIESQIEMSESFPYVYDMTYDYTTATMFVLAGASEDNTDLYVMNMETGELTLLMEIEPQLMAIAAARDGKIYAIENSVGEMDFETWTTVYTNAQLYSVNPLEGTLELIGDTGVVCNMINSMTYDYDTDALYWHAFAQTGNYSSQLCIVNTETGAATSLGATGVAGAQIGGLYVICDEFPETDTENLHALILGQSKALIFTGETKTVSSLLIPGNVDAAITWTSSDASVATVDENGVITGVSQGTAVITATASYNGVAKSASCNITVLDEDAAFLAYNADDAGWALISRKDYTVVTNLTEGEDLPTVMAIASVGKDVYGYDENNQLFRLNTSTYERTAIGECPKPELDTEAEYQFKVVDMGYDAANDRMLVLGQFKVYDEWFGDYYDEFGAATIYSVDLTTGELTALMNFPDLSYVLAMSVGTNGEVYLYSTFNDVLSVWNLETGESSTVVNLQTQSLYGDGEYEYSMFYDELTNVIYLLFTSNGRFHKMITVDATLGTLLDNGYVGEYYEVDGYYYADLVYGLTFVDTSCTDHTVENGVCTNCGKVFVEITKQPTDVTVANGEKAVVSFEATGSGLNYQWYFKNAGSSKFSLTTAFSSNKYSVIMNSSRAGRQVYCVVTDENGYSVVTDTVTLKMSATPLEIIQQPVDVTVGAGQTATVTVEASGDGLTYNWYFKNAGATKFSHTSTFTGPSYYIAMNATRAGRQVYCVITDAYGNSVTTDTVTLSMATLKITSQPVNATAENGKTATVNVGVEGTGELTYKWYYKNASASSFSYTSSFSGPSYYVEMNASRAGRQVYCVISDTYGNTVTTDTVTLNMGTPLSIVTQPKSVTVGSGKKALVTLEAVGEGLTYQWYYRNVDSSEFTLTTTFTSNTYSVVMSAARDGRQIYCVITDRFGNSVTSDVVTLNME